MVLFFTLAVLALLLVSRVVGDESIGFGGTCEIDDGGTGAAPGSTFEEIAKVTSLGVPSEKVGVVESKTLDLPGGVIRKLPTLKDGGEFSIKQQFTHAGWARMETIRAAKQVHEWKFTIPDDDGDTEITVTGFITENKTE
jgi:hypothetical protein